MLGKSKTPWKLARLLMVLCWGMWILTFFTAVTLLQASMRVRVLAQVVQTADRGFLSFKDDLMQFAPLEVMSPALVDEMLLRYYLEMRYSIIPDQQEMERRWGPRGIVAYLSTPAAYRAFQEPSLYLSTIENQRARVVDVVSVKRLGNEYTVEMHVYIDDGVRGWKKQVKNLSVEFTYAPGRVLLGKRMSNPKGFIVTYVSDIETKKK